MENDTSRKKEKKGQKGKARHDCYSWNFFRVASLQIKLAKATKSSKFMNIFHPLLTQSCQYPFSVHHFQPEPDFKN